MLNEPHYYLNIKFIKQVMEKRNFTVKQLAKEFDISERRINNYLQGKVFKKVPFKIWYMFYSKLNLKFKELITTEPPELQ